MRFLPETPVAWTLAVTIAGCFAAKTDGFIGRPALELLGDAESLFYPAVRIEFALSCPGCFTSVEADDALDFSFTFTDSSTDDSGHSFIGALNNYTYVGRRQSDSVFVEAKHVRGQRFEETQDHVYAGPLIDLDLTDIPFDLTSGAHYLWYRILKYNNSIMDEPLGFVIATSPGRVPRVMAIGSEANLIGQAMNTTRPSDDPWSRTAGDDEDWDQDLPPYSNPESADFNLELALEQLKVYQHNLAHQQQRIAKYLDHYAHHDTLRDLLAACDGLMCRVKVLTKKLGDAVGTSSPSEKQDFQMLDAYVQHPTRLPSATPSKSMSSNSTTGHRAPQAQHAQLSPFEMPKANNPLVIFLEVLASLIGLTTLCRLIRNRCMSLRTKVERAADREEKSNARAYRRAAKRAARAERRAARKALWQKRWETIRSSLNCFAPQEQELKQGYEEKRALILQDAYLANLGDLEAGERGEVMEAEIRQLRHANEIVSSLVQGLEQRHLVGSTPVRDPPPSMIPLPYSTGSRSRSSTATLPSLPSYATSEGLPEYSSQAESNSVVSVPTGVCTPNTFEGQRSRTGSQAATNLTGSTRFTAPGSSIIEVTPRASEDTVRTVLSKYSYDS